MEEFTLGELRRLVDRTAGKKIPTASALRESGIPVVAFAKVGDGALTVYKNGFYTYSVPGSTTVYAVDRCTGYAYDGGAALEAAFFENKEWTLCLTLAGEDRLIHNNNVREENRHFSYSGDAVEGQDLRDPHDFTVDLENRDMVERLLGVLTERQRQVVKMYFEAGLTQQQIADRLGIKRRTIGDSLEAAMEKLKKL